MRSLLLLIVVLFGCAPALADAPLVYATIEPAKITMGQSAVLRITSLGPDMDAYTLPVVSGLDFEVLGHARQMEFVNGTTLTSTSIVVRVSPQIAGIFKIPPVTLKSQPLILEVVPATPTNASRAASSGTPEKPDTVTGPVADGIRMTTDGSAFLRLGMPKRAVFVGESVPVDIELGLRSGYVTALHGLPTLSGSEFTLNNLSTQPAREEKKIDGKPFVVFSWHSVIAAVKPGIYSLSVETPITVKIRTQSRRESALDDYLGDPFLQNIFGATVQKDITVSSPVTELKVLALPTEGRPRDFSGAVGNFTVQSEISSATAAAGDPLTLRMRIIGAGNFDRVDSAMLQHLDDWKTYPTTSSFKPSDTVGYKGEKTFEQPLIAAKPGEQILPGMAFNYFDPVARRYDTARSPALSVTISPALADSTLTAPKIGASSSSMVANQAQTHLRPDHALIGDSSVSLVPLYLRTEFLALPATLALTFVGGWIGLRRRYLDTMRGASMRGPGTSMATRRLLASLEAAARSPDPTQFFNLARSTLETALAARWHVTADEITPEMVNSRLSGDGEEVRQLFALADEAKYSGHGVNRIDFSRWTQLVHRTLTSEVA
jgi:hypothetical protein